MKKLLYLYELIEWNYRENLFYKTNSNISNFIKSMPDISKTSRINNLHYKFANSFITLLYVYDILMPDISKKKQCGKLKGFLDGRVVKNKI